MKNDTFRVVNRSSVPEGLRIYGTRLIDAIKTVDGKAFQKSRLVAQNYRDYAATEIATKSPTISRMWQRVLLALSASYPEYELYLRDISQAYVQSKFNLDRLVYLKPPKELGIGKEKVLLLLKPLYGIPESGLHWFVTYVEYHKEKRGMEQTRADPCFLFKREGSKLQAATVLQVDESLGFGDKWFMKCEDNISNHFKCKPRKIITKIWMKSLTEWL